MSSEISSMIEGEQPDENPFSKKVFQIIEYGILNPDRKWEDNKDLVYMDFKSPDGSENTISIKKIHSLYWSAGEYSRNSKKYKPGLYARFYYIKSKISLAELGEISPEDCEVTHMIIPRSKILRIITDLSKKVTSITSGMPKIAKEEIQTHLDAWFYLLTHSDEKHLFFEKKYPDRTGKFSIQEESF